MARKTRNHLLDLPPLELECMKALWALGAASVHGVRAKLEPQRLLAYTTVMTVLDRLARKGLASREKLGRAHIYHPMVAEGIVRDRAVQRLVESFFGSRKELRQYLDGGVFSPRSTSAGMRTEADEQGIDPSLL